VSNDDSVKLLGTFYRYQPIGRVTLASAIRIGGSLLGTLRFVDPFFVGGADTVRGYGEDALGPKNFLGAQGGDSLLVLNQEIRAPIYKWLRGVAFIDAGNVFSRNRPSLSGLDVGYGVGIRLHTPFSILRVDMGVPARSGSKRWYFGIGQIFWARTRDEREGAETPPEERPYARCRRRSANGARRENPTPPHVVRSASQGVERELHLTPFRGVGGQLQEHLEVLGHPVEPLGALMRDPGVVVGVGELGHEFGGAIEHLRGFIELVLANQCQAELIVRETRVAVDVAGAPGGADRLVEIVVEQADRRLANGRPRLVVTARQLGKFSARVLVAVEFQQGLSGQIGRGRVVVTGLTFGFDALHRFRVGAAFEQPLGRILGRRGNRQRHGHGRAGHREQGGSGHANYSAKQVPLMTVAVCLGNWSIDDRLMSLGRTACPLACTN